MHVHMHAKGLWPLANLIVNLCCGVYTHVFTIWLSQIGRKCIVENKKCSDSSLRNYALSGLLHLIMRVSTIIYLYMCYIIYPYRQ